MVKRFLLTSAVVALAIGSMVATTNADTLYVSHGGANDGAPFGGEIGTIDLVTGAYTDIGTPIPGVGLTGLAFGGGILVASTSSHEVITVDPNTAALLTRAAFNGAGFDSAHRDRVTDLAYDPISNTFFAAGRIDGFFNDQLLTVDPMTGALTSIGIFGANDGGFESIAFTEDGTLYSHETNTDSFWLVDPSNADLLQQIGGVPRGALGLAVDPATGLVIASECCTGVGLGERIFIIDVATGNATLLYDYADGRRIHDLAFVILDADGDGIPDTDDNCPDDPNPDQADADEDGVGNVCDPDIDGDNVPNEHDNCVFDYNPDQEDLEEDGIGDACDVDDDNDGVLDADDACMPTPAGEIVNADGCSIAQLCPCDDRGGADQWKNHGAYVSCVAHESNDFAVAGLLTGKEKGAIASEAGRSDCGHKRR